MNTKLTSEYISVFDIFKIGVGPSSSHTMGPWLAALKFLDKHPPEHISELTVRLYGSLAKTGKGHGTDIAVMLGLEGYHPTTVDTSKISDYVSSIQLTKRLSLGGRTSIEFDPDKHIEFINFKLPFHPNGLTFEARLHSGQVVSETFYSVGGGFIVQEGEEENTSAAALEVPYPVSTGEELLHHTQTTGLSISELVMQNELVFRSREEIEAQLIKIWETMLECVYKGCHTSGILPGGLGVRRRAHLINQQLLEGTEYTTLNGWLRTIRLSGALFSNVTKWVSCFALAVNEENAAFGRVVTAPTNGAAGVIPSVLLYYLCFCDNKGQQDVIRFLLTAGIVGSLFKKGSTISAAMGGCQAEIGVSSAMAAAALTECMGGSPQRALMAAEIAMEHHLGLTCDPIRGLVQVPCIERNTMGAMKAITASQIALSSDPALARVSFDDVIKTMWETAKDMSDKYKETADGGLAINVSVKVPEC